MGLVILLAVGGFLGWLSSIVVAVRATNAKLIYIGASVVGALGAGLIAASGASLSAINPQTILAAILGAVFFIVVAHMLRQNIRTGA